MQVKRGGATDEAEERKPKTAATHTGSVNQHDDQPEYRADRGKSQQTAAKIAEEGLHQRDGLCPLGEFLSLLQREQPGSIKLGGIDGHNDKLPAA